MIGRMSLHETELGSWRSSSDTLLRAHSTIYFSFVIYMIHCAFAQFIWPGWLELALQSSLLACYGTLDIYTLQVWG